MLTGLITHHRYHTYLNLKPQMVLNLTWYTRFEIINVLFVLLIVLFNLYNKAVTFGKYIVLNNAWIIKIIFVLIVS